MDAETFDAIHSLRNEIRRLGTSVNARFDTVDSRLDTLESRFDILESRFDSLDSRFDSLDSRFDTLESRFDTLESSLAARIDDAKADMKRHFDIVAESTHDDVRIIAEGLVALNAKVDAMRPS
ncbi:MAG TPA: hypothetical protein VJ032_13295 [Thermoanaerobaculia bacterium]|nr:hypothetical protein [Thermoanaerobaculia bacterium]